jgi:Methylamine utilisation protein MauE
MVLRIVLGTVFTAMALGQLASIGEMPRILAAYGLVDHAAVMVVAVALIVGELVCGVWFLARPRSRAVVPVWAYTAVAVVWSGMAVQAYGRGLVVANCGCFGVYLSQSLSWFVFVEDALMLFYAVLLLRCSRGARAGPGAQEAARRADERHAKRAEMRGDGP